MLRIESFAFGYSGYPMTEYTCLYNGTSHKFSCKGWRLIYKDIITNRILHEHKPILRGSGGLGEFDSGERMLLFSGKGINDFFRGEDTCFKYPHWKIFLDQDNLIVNTTSCEILLCENDKILVSQKYENDKKKVFIVHGRDENTKKNVTEFIKKLGFIPIILDEQASGGQTIIEKLETYSNVGFGVILYTPCDLGKKKGDEKLSPRARQNVVFEHGYLIAKLGRKNVVALVKDEIERPNDISGIIYIPYKKGCDWRKKLADEMKNTGY